VEQKSHTKAPWRTSCGQILILKRRISQYLLGEWISDHLVNNYASLIRCDTGVLATPLAQGSCTSSYSKTICPISFAPINFAWRGTLRSLTSISQQFGRHQTTAIVVGTPLASWRSVPEGACFSTFSKLHRRMTRMGQRNRHSKTPLEEYVDSLFLYTDLAHWPTKLPEYFL